VFCKALCRLNRFVVEPWCRQLDCCREIGWRMMMRHTVMRLCMYAIYLFPIFFISLSVILVSE
jgi:hypothetical protein